MIQGLPENPLVNAGTELIMGIYLAFHIYGYHALRGASH